MCKLCVFYYSHLLSAQSQVISQECSSSPATGDSRAPLELLELISTAEINRPGFKSTCFENQERLAAGARLIIWHCLSILFCTAACLSKDSRGSESQSEISAVPFLLDYNWKNTLDFPFWLREHWVTAACTCLFARWLKKLLIWTEISSLLDE